MRDSPVPLTEARREGEENAIIVYQLNQMRVILGFAHCQSRMLEGLPRPGLVSLGQGRQSEKQESDLGAFLGYPSPTMHLSFLQL